MIAYIQGSVLSRGEDWVVVQVGGIGWRIALPRSDAAHLPAVGGETSLYTHMHVRENDISLYGFLSPDARALFELLLTVSGIGPKLALSIVSVVTVDELQHAVASGDPSVLGKAPGVGKRTAERVLLGLKDKLGVGHEIASHLTSRQGDPEVVSALISLGYSLAEATAALHSLPQEDLPLEERLRLALQSLASA